MGEERLQLRQELAAKKAADAEIQKEKRRELAERKAANLQKKMKEMDDDEEDELPTKKKKFNPLYRAKGGKAKKGKLGVKERFHKSQKGGGKGGKSKKTRK